MSGEVTLQKDDVTGKHKASAMIKFLISLHVRKALTDASFNREGSLVILKYGILVA